VGRIKEIRKAIAACFQANNEPLTRAQVFAWVGTNYREADFNSNTLQAQLYRSCINSKAKTSAPKILWYEKATKTYRLLLPTDPLDEHSSVLMGVETVDDTDAQAASTFALEAHLRDYLAKNLSTLEKGLELWSFSPPSVEYWVENRRIDLLAKDSEGLPVIIELKLKRGYDEVVGQALLYRGLLVRKFRLPRVRIMLVANEISYSLRMACSTLPDVELFEYAITMKIDKVTSTLIEEEIENGSSGR
jgi:hypothetical protein